MPEKTRQRVNRIGFYFFADGAFDVVKFQNDLYEQATERVLAIVSDLEKRDDFPPVINPLCSSCGYVSLCPAFNKVEGVSI
jgi:CRISPR/Cas system-associated exonuclease Cas4 (RecB family)